MKLANAITIGFRRTMGSIKPILIIWLISLAGISLLAGPFKSSLIAAVGNSFGTEMIRESFSIDFWTGLDPVIMSSLLGLMKGFLILLFIFIFISAFLTGGLFDSLRANVCCYPAKDFFKASAANFFSFLVATFMVQLMIIFSAGIIIGIPVLIARGAENGEVAMFKVLNISRIVFFAVLPIFLLVVDYTRAWLSASEQKRVFKALGYGFKATFKSFVASYLFMVLIVGVQLGFMYLVTRALNFNPSSTGGLFLLFVLTQVLFIIKVFLRTWRYGGVTTLHTI